MLLLLWAYDVFCSQACHSCRKHCLWFAAFYFMYLHICTFTFWSFCFCFECLFSRCVFNGAIFILDNTKNVSRSFQVSMLVLYRLCVWIYEINFTGVCFSFLFIAFSNIRIKLLLIAFELEIYSWSKVHLQSMKLNFERFIMLIEIEFFFSTFQNF